MTDRIKKQISSRTFLCKIVLVAIIGFSLVACEYEKLGEVVVEERTATGFVEIASKSSVDVNLYTGKDYKVIVKADEKNLNKIVTEVRDGILHIEGKGIIRAKGLTVDVYMPKLKAIAVTGSGDVKVNSGIASNLEIKISGSGDIDTRNYQVEDINITSTGSGDSKIWVTETLTGKLSGSGDILYKGNPKVSVNDTGSGDVKRL